MSNNNSDFFEAAAAGDLDYLKKNIKLIREKNERGWTALHFAARFGQLESAKFLKENGADLTVTNGEGKTASQVAAFWGNDAIAQLLAVAAAPTADTAVVGGSPFPENYSAVFAGNPLNRQV
jgi:NAD+ diphosphatase